MSLCGITAGKKLNKIIINMPKKTKKQQGFIIDFFEFGFLVETCIPPVPIARAMFFQKVIDCYYHQLTTEERIRLYDWIMKTYRMEKGVEENNEDCLLFCARYNPDNQYLVTTVYNGEEKTVEAFKNRNSEGIERFYISKNTSLVEDYITKVEKINLES
jgi:hypothetical protein